MVRFGSLRPGHVPRTWPHTGETYNRHEDSDEVTYTDVKGYNTQHITGHHPRTTPRLRRVAKLGMELVAVGSETRKGSGHKRYPSLHDHRAGRGKAGEKREPWSTATTTPVRPLSCVLFLDGQSRMIRTAKPRGGMRGMRVSRRPSYLFYLTHPIYPGDRMTDRQKVMNFH